jgi:hypothetical protein
LGLALLVAVISAGAGWAIATGWAGHASSKKPALLPDHLGDQMLFYAEPHMTAIVRADGTVIRTFPQLAAIGYPTPPLTTAGHSIVFVHDHQAYRVGPTPRSLVQHVGAADRLFPTDGGGVGLQVGGDGDQSGAPAIVEYMAADGTLSQPHNTSTALPGGTTAIARMIVGLLVLTGDNQLKFAGTGPELHVGPVNRVIGTSVATVAWTDGGGGGCLPNPGSCLHLTDTASGTDRMITPPAGFAGFVGGGAFSPTGTWLAAFVFTPADTGPGLRLVLIDTRLGRAQVVGPVLPAGEAIGSAAWSSDGQWIFFSGLSGPLYAQRMESSGPVSAPVALALPATYAFTPL